MALWAWAALVWILVIPLFPLTSLAASRLAWARDRWLLGLVGVALFYLAALEPALAAVALAAVLQWKGPEQLPGVVVYAAIIGAWFVVAALPPVVVRWLPVGLVGVALFHAARPVWQHATRDVVSGHLGHRTLSAGVLALLLPFFWPWLAFPTGLALLVEQSWLAWIAGAVAVSVMEPWALPVFLSAALLMLLPIVHVARMPVTYQRPPSENTWLDRISRRGTSIDSIRARAVAFRALFARLSWRGAGAHSATRLMLRGGAPYGGHAHCEPLEYVVEYGAVGAVALVALVWRLVPHLRLHDPWTAMVAAGAILMLGSYPARVPQIGGLWWVACSLVAHR